MPKPERPVIFEHGLEASGTALMEESVASLLCDASQAPHKGLTGRRSLGKQPTWLPFLCTSHAHTHQRPDFAIHFASKHTHTHLCASHPSIPLKGPGTSPAYGTGCNLPRAAAEVPPTYLLLVPDTCAWSLGSVTTHEAPAAPVHPSINLPTYLIAIFTYTRAYTCAPLVRLALRCHVLHQPDLRRRRRWHFPGCEDELLGLRRPHQARQPLRAENTQEEGALRQAARQAAWKQAACDAVAARDGWAFQPRI